MIPPTKQTIGIVIIPAKVPFIKLSISFFSIIDMATGNVKLTKVPRVDDNSTPEKSLISEDKAIVSLRE